MNELQHDIRVKENIFQEQDVFYETLKEKEQKLIEQKRY